MAMKPHFKMIRNKKAVFFTIIAIVLSFALLFFYISNNRHEFVDSSKVVQTRVLSMDSFISDVEHDIDRGLYISSMRSIIGMAEYISRNGTFISNFSSTFNEIMFNGSVYGYELNISSDSNIGIWIQKIIDQGEKLDIDIEFTSINLSIYHVSPWDVETSFESDINLTDRKKIAGWQRHLKVTARMNIVDFEDPLYTVFSKGKYTNKVIMSNATISSLPGLLAHANNSWYIASNRSPSFLMRFYGDMSNSTFGIESIVNSPKLQSAAPEAYRIDAISLDYLYFNSTSTGCVVNESIETIPWFRLNDSLSMDYGVHCS